MAKNAPVALSSAWTQLTANDVTSITLQNIGGNDVQVMGTVGAVAPAATESPTGLVLEYGVAILNRTMADLFPGVAATRVYARTNPGFPNAAALVFVSHA